MAQEEEEQVHSLNNAEEEEIFFSFTEEELAEDITENEETDDATEETKDDNQEKREEGYESEDEEGDKEGDEEDEGGGSEDEGGGSEDEEDEGGEEEDEKDEGDKGDVDKEDESSGEGERDDEREGREELHTGEPDDIASHIIDTILQEAIQASHSATSIDSLVLQELKESEDTALHLASQLEDRKQEIKELRLIPITPELARDIEGKQIEIQQMVESLQRLTEKIQELLDASIRPSTNPPWKSVERPKVCPHCGQEKCICEIKHVCICKPEVCICDEPEPYIAGEFYKYQVEPYPLKLKEDTTTPVCICGSQENVCICKEQILSDEEDDECKCRREDLAKFDIIADVMPKVVVCAPDISLPRIIVCEPYTPRKIVPRQRCDYDY